MWPFKPDKPARELLADLEHENHERRQEAFKGLQDSEDPETDWLLLQALKSWQQSPKDRILPLIDLIGIRGIEEGIELLKTLVHEAEGEWKEAALRALRRIPSQRTLDVILPLLADPDLTIRNNVREIVVQVYGKEAMGAILRTIPHDRSCPLYFELVTLFEEMGFFEDLQENFLHRDQEVRTFHLRNMLKFHRPEFVPLFLDFAKGTSSESLAQVQEALLDYAPDELIPAFRDELTKENPPEPIIRLANNVLFSRFPDARDRLITLVQSITRSDLQIRFLEQLLRQPDIYLFQPLVPLLNSSNTQTRKAAAATLVMLARSTAARIKDPREAKRSQLLELFATWHQAILTLLFAERRPDDMKDILRVFFALAEADQAILQPILPRLLSDFFADALQCLAQWPFSDVFGLFQTAIHQDPSFGSLLVSGLGRSSQPLLIKTILKILPELDAQDQEALRRKLSARTTTFKVADYLDDPDAAVRASAFEIAAANTPETILPLLEKRLKDPSAEVRRVAMRVVLNTRHPKLIEILQDALADPASDVAMLAIEGLKSILPEAKMVPIYKKLLTSPAEEVRNYALNHIARLTQAKFVENFNRLPPDVRKLAGAAIQKLDGTFVEQVSEELRSLDPATRLRAALILENLHVTAKARDALLDAMKDPDRRVRAAVVKTLGVLGDRELLSRLIEFFNDPDERVRANAIEGISSIGDQRAVQLLLPFLEDKNNRIRGNAVLAIWQIAKANVFPVLRKMLQEKETLMKASALWVIGEIGGEAYLPLILPFFSAKDAILRLNAIRTAGKIKPETIKPYLPTLRKDPAPEVRDLIAELSKRIL